MMRQRRKAAHQPEGYMAPRLRDYAAIFAEDCLFWFMELPRTIRWTVACLMIAAAVFAGNAITVSGYQHRQHYRELVAAEPHFSATWYQGPWRPRAGREQWVEIRGQREELAIQLESNPLPAQGEQIKVVRDPADHEIVVPVDFEVGPWNSAWGRLAVVLMGFGLPIVLAAGPVYLLLADEFGRMAKFVDVRVGKILQMPPGTGKRRRP
ncbi:hypothetical protein ACFY5D_05735 [Paeniglutamicibacter sp. NPDC012692]|uniref:hypothetical protein n=1 Tax=Paeniglutamicibacter sp. NPDC012692 TaxID=3364388 RepID=UPI0036C21BD5